jgi:hypothetical protein
MNRHLIPLFCAATMVLASNGEAAPRRYPIKPVVRSYLQIAQSVANMVGDQRAQSLVQAKKLNIVNVMWEDTGRYQGSSVGPNISDVTIEVEAEGRNGHKQRLLMPVIRYPNFTDKTGDVDIDKFFIRVGNHKKNGKLDSVSLRQFLAHPTRYMSLPGVGKIKGNTLLADRDEHILTSAQAAFLPIRSQGKARFWPVIFNYQSYQKNPAVLTLLVTRQGTSMTIIDNNRDTVGGGASWGQRLYFNAGGARAPLTAERLTDVMNKGTTSNGESAASLGKDSNLLVIIQIPLKVKGRPMMVYADMEDAPMATGGGMVKESSRRSFGGSDMDTAVLGHGPSEGPYTELDGLTIERDMRFPVRATVQFYQATSNGVVNQENVAALAAQIDKVYSHADYVGSLVVPDGKVRPTEWDNATTAPPHLSWRDFPGLRERFEKYDFYGMNWYERMFRY